MVPIIPSAAPNNTNPAPLSPEREAEIRERLGSTLAARMSDVRILLAEVDRLRAELAALPAPVVEHGILTADGGAWLLDKVDDDRRKLILQYTPAMQRIVRYGEWTEVTS